MNQFAKICHHAAYLHVQNWWLICLLLPCFEVQLAKCTTELISFSMSSLPGVTLFVCAVLLAGLRGQFVDNRRYQRATLFCTSCTAMPLLPDDVISKLLLKESEAARLSAERLVLAALLLPGCATSHVEKEKMSRGR